MIQRMGGKDPRTSRFSRRVSRYRKVGNFWYFSTREGIIMGPYSSRDVAEEETAKYIQFAQHTKSHVLKIMMRKSTALTRP